jgi:hypothetical protein
MALDAHIWKHPFLASFGYAKSVTLTQFAPRSFLREQSGFEI